MSQYQLVRSRLKHWRPQIIHDRYQRFNVATKLSCLERCSKEENITSIVTSSSSTEKCIIHVRFCARRINVTCVGFDLVSFGIVPSLDFAEASCFCYFIKEICILIIKLYLSTNKSVKGLDLSKITITKISFIIQTIVANTPAIMVSKDTQAQIPLYVNKEKQLIHDFN